MAGKPCYKAVVTPVDLPAQTMFFDKESHLLTKAMMTTESQAGTIPVESYLSDYKPLDGVLMPRKSVTKVLG